MDILNTEFKRKFSLSLYKNLKLKLAEMTFCKDFINDTRGDLYPIIERSADCAEFVEHNRYILKSGSAKRLICDFFPYATYELTADVSQGSAGFCFMLPCAEASLILHKRNLLYSCNGNERELILPYHTESGTAMIVSCRPGAFDVYFKLNNKPEFFCTIEEEAFLNSHSYSLFTDAKVSLTVSGSAEVSEVSSYIDNGVSIADIRPIRYENGEIMTEHGRVCLTASIRMQAQSFQGVFSWIPGTAEFELSGALFYDAGDGKWCGDVAASILYHRGECKWYLWVCSFSHGHILGHSSFDGDPRFGVNVIDIELMKKAPAGSEISEFLGFSGDEDPDFFYDEKEDRWLMAICRLDPKNRKYRYVFFESAKPFEGYSYIGKGFEGAETGGSFVKVDGEQFFLCGNDFHAVSDYRIYHKNGMTAAKFDHPDGGFRGWGTLIPIKTGSRTRYFWLTFDRHKGSNYNWSYGNLYCFEAY